MQHDVLEEKIRKIRSDLYDYAIRQGLIRHKEDGNNIRRIIDGLCLEAEESYRALGMSDEKVKRIEDVYMRNLCDSLSFLVQESPKVDPEPEIADLDESPFYTGNVYICTTTGFSYSDTIGPFFIDIPLPFIRETYIEAMEDINYDFRFIKKDNNVVIGIFENNTLERIGEGIFLWSRSNMLATIGEPEFIAMGGKIYEAIEDGYDSYRRGREIHHSFAAVFSNLEKPVAIINKGFSIDVLR